MLTKVLRVRYGLVLAITTLSLIVIAPFLGVTDSASQAQIPNHVQVDYWEPDPNSWPQDDVITCPPQICDRQDLIGGGTAHSPVLNVLPPNAVSSSRFVTVPGASSDPADIVQLVNDAVSVWERAFDPASFPQLTIHVGWTNFGVNSFSYANGTLQTVPGNPDDLGSIAGDVIGLHICGTPIAIDLNVPPQLDGYCDPSILNEATILFNSQKILAGGAGLQQEIKLLLDLDPFNSSGIYGPLSDIQRGGNKLEVDALGAPYVIDLFTVALHEVGHALGFSQVNEAVRELLDQDPYDDLDSAHIPSQNPAVLNQYLGLNMRVCPTEFDVATIKDFGSYVPGATEYNIISDDPCRNEPTRSYP